MRETQSVNVGKHNMNVKSIPTDTNEDNNTVYYLKHRWFYNYLKQKI